MAKPAKTKPARTSSKPQTYRVITAAGEDITVQSPSVDIGAEGALVFHKANQVSRAWASGAWKSVELVPNTEG